MLVGSRKHVLSSLMHGLLKGTLFYPCQPISRVHAIDHGNRVELHDVLLAPYTNFAPQVSRIEFKERREGKNPVPKSSVFDPLLSPQSWGFRPRRSPEEALLQVRSSIRGGAHWAFKTDIHHFFDNVDRSLLEKVLRAAIPDASLVDAILNFTTPPVVDRGVSRYRLHGLPQGNGLSPILSNLYLHPLDMACADLRYFRYADDFLLLFHTAQEAQRAKAFLSKALSLLGLKLKLKKTFLLNLQRRPLVFLGYAIRGGNLYPSRKSIFAFRRKLNPGGKARARL